MLAENSVSQMFIAEKNNLTKIGVRTVTQDRTINSKVNIEIKEIETKETIFNKEISLIDAKNDTYFEIQLDKKQKYSQNKKYEIIITSLDATQDTATMFALAKNTESTEENYKYNNEEITQNKIMLSLEYEDSSSKVFSIILWFFVFILAIIFVLYGLDSADEKTFLKLTLCITILYVFVIPFPHYLDEGAHFFRAVLISQGDFYDEIDDNGEIGGYVFENFPDYVFKGLTLKNFSENLLPTGDLFSENKIFFPFKYFSSTIPLGHTISALGLLIGNIINLNSYLTIYLARLLLYVF